MRIEYIEQKDLLAALNLTDFKDERGIRDWPDELTPKLDPDGTMVVNFSFLHNDGPDIRVVAFAKVRDRMEPADVVFTLPGKFADLLKVGEVADHDASDSGIGAVDGSTRLGAL